VQWANNPARRTRLNTKRTPPRGGGANRYGGDERRRVILHKKRGAMPVDEAQVDCAAFFVVNTYEL